jgi:Xaa-Pro aminopeptidase
MKKITDNILSENNITAAIFIHTKEHPDPSVQYISGVAFDFACMILKKNTKPIILCSPLEKKKSPKARILQFSAKVLKKKLQNVKTIGINAKSLPIQSLSNIKKIIGKKKTIDISKTIESIRAIKTREEIKKITKAVQITEIILKACILQFKKFKKEEEVVVFLKTQAIAHNCEPAFEPIVASGKNAATPHHISKGKLLKGFCIIDFGVKYKGYCADMTRTIYIGKPSVAEQKIYKNIDKAHHTLLKEIQPRMTCAETMKLFTALTKKQLIHALGHGIGLEVHEKPLLGNNAELIQQGSVLAIEPATYVKNKYGIRIEDNLLIGKKNKRISTMTTKLVYV